MINHHWSNRQCQSLLLNVFLLFAITSCNGTAHVTPLAPSILNTSTQTSTLSKTTMVGEIQGTQAPSLFTPSPTALLKATNHDRRNCGRFDDAGHILFLTGTSSISDLRVMNGNGCFDTLLMKNVSGSPAWSKDGKQIAIGCDDNTSICILDAQKTLRSCSLPENKEKNRCEPDIVQKIKLPQEISGETELVTLSWSPDSDRIAVDGRSINEISEYIVFVRSFASEGDWQAITRRSFPYHVDWSPTGDQLAVTGGIIDLGDANQVLHVTPGFDPAWSPDGKSIAVVIPSEDKNKEPFGIGVVHIGKEGWNWLYEPAAREGPTKDIILNTSGEKRVLSWSPDGRYLAFVSLYQHQYDSQIFRLDLSTGQVTLLTEKFTTRENGHYCFAPAWGP